MSVFTKNIDVSSHTLVQQSDLQPHKRIKLNNKSKLTVTSYLIRLENANSSSDALEVLLLFYNLYCLKYTVLFRFFVILVMQYNMMLLV